MSGELVCTTEKVEWRAVFASGFQAVYGSEIFARDEAREFGGKVQARTCICTPWRDA